jgi:hypothetical protein
VRPFQLPKHRVVAIPGCYGRDTEAGLDPVPLGKSQTAILSGIAIPAISLGVGRQSFETVLELERGPPIMQIVAIAAPAGRVAYPRFHPTSPLVGTSL